MLGLARFKFGCVRCAPSLSLAAPTPAAPSSIRSGFALFELKLPVRGAWASQACFFVHSLRSVGRPCRIRPGSTCAPHPLTPNSYPRLLLFSPQLGHLPLLGFGTRVVACSGKVKQLHTLSACLPTHQLFVRTAIRLVWVGVGSPYCCLHRTSPSLVPWPSKSIVWCCRSLVQPLSVECPCLFVAARRPTRQPS